MILCCGEALIDMLPRETTQGEKGFAPYAGGAIFNTAIALGRLGVPTAFFTGLADDMMGEILRETLTASKVDFSPCAIVSRPSTIAFVKLVNGQATYAFYDEGTAGRMITEADLPTLDDRCEALHFGAISLIPEPCGSTYEALMDREHARRVISLDPNIRPGFIKDKQAHMARISRMAAMSDILKFSDEDLAWFGIEGDHDALAAHWLNHGAKLVVITKGAEGAEGYTRSLKVTVPSERVTRGRHGRSGRYFRRRHPCLAENEQPADEGRGRFTRRKGAPRRAGARRQGSSGHRFPRGRKSALGA